MTGILGWIEAHAALAGWVQAIASVAAIWWAGRISVRLQRAELQHSRRQVGEALVEIAQLTVEAAEYVTVTIPDRQTVHDIGELRKYYDAKILAQMEETVSAVALHDLNTAKLVRHVILLRTLIGRLRGGVEQVLAKHRELNAEAFDEFFSTNENLKRAITDICAKIRTEVTAIS